MTRIEALEYAKNVVVEADIDEEEQAEVIEAIEAEISSLTKRAASAKARREKKAAEGDALRARVFELVSEEPKTAADIWEELDDESVTKAKVTARLTQLKKAGEIETVKVKVEGAGKKSAYVLAGTVIESDDETGEDEE